MLITEAQLFDFCNTLVLPQWFCLVLFRRSWVTRWLLRYQPIILTLAVCYVWRVFFWPSTGASDFSFSDFSHYEGVRKLFMSGDAVVAGWVHYLAFDLFVGSWITTNALRHRVPAWACAPAVLGTFMLGPSGLLLYWGIREFRNRL
jgi:hypothetical protein